MSTPPPSSPPFGPETIAFLEDLRFHNEREWFQDNKARYEAHFLAPALAYIQAMEPRLARIAPRLRAEAKKSGGSLMRIYRDVRFSKDKAPYKTNMGIQFRHEAGKDVHAPGLYLHVEPGGCFLAGGMWRPASKPLRAIREAIAEAPEDWLAVRDGILSKGWALEGESLKSAPRGFDKEHPQIDELRRKDFIAVDRLSDEQLYGEDFPERSAARFDELRPLMAYLCRVNGLSYD